MSEEDEKFALRNRLRKFMKEKGLSYKELSETSGVALKTIYGWTAGNRPRNLDDLKKVANTLGISIDSLSFDGGVSTATDGPSEASLWLAQCRREQGLYPWDVAPLVGISAQDLILYETQKDIPFRVFLKLCRAYQKNEKEVVDMVASVFRLQLLEATNPPTK